MFLSIALTSYHPEILRGALQSRFSLGRHRGRGTERAGEVFLLQWQREVFTLSENRASRPKSQLMWRSRRPLMSPLPSGARSLRKICDLWEEGGGAHKSGLSTMLGAFAVHLGEWKSFNPDNFSKEKMLRGRVLSWKVRCGAPWRPGLGSSLALIILPKKEISQWPGRSSYAPFKTKFCPVKTLPEGTLQKPVVLRVPAPFSGHSSVLRAPLTFQERSCFPARQNGFHAQNYALRTLRTHLTFQDRAHLPELSPGQFSKMPSTQHVFPGSFCFWHTGQAQRQRGWALQEGDLFVAPCVQSHSERLMWSW